MKVIQGMNMRLRFSFLNARKQEIQIIEKRAMRTVEGKWREVAF